jgi:hypothetical protein
MSPMPPPASDFDLLISNYPPSKEDSVIQAVQDEVHRRIQSRPRFTQYSAVSGGLRVKVPTEMEFDTLLSINGALILNYPIWIVKFPDFLNAFVPFLSRVFQKNSVDGIVDLSNLAQKVRDAGASAGCVNLNNRDFVEFLLFQLGTQARDSRFWVRAIVLGGNGIEAIDMWTRFFHFLPNLRVIDVRGNTLQRRPQFADWPKLVVECDVSQ